jgi:hypothetical protein
MSKPIANFAQEKILEIIKRFKNMNEWMNKSMMFEARNTYLLWMEHKMAICELT